MKNIIITTILSVLLSSFTTFLFTAAYYDRKWCVENPQKCAAREARLKAENAKHNNNLSCGITMPGMDPGWGGWRCKYDD